MIIFCWTFPRTRSTAFEKSMAQIVHTLHEPFSAGYYALNGKTIDVETHEVDFDHVVKFIERLEKQHSIIFIKELAYCVVRQEEAFRRHAKFFDQCKHMYLIRDPKETIPSLIRQMRRVYGKDCSLEQIKKAVGIKDVLLMKQNHDGLLVDSGRLVQDTENTLRKICLYLGLKFDSKMMKWEKGSLPDWKIWGDKGWHDAAIESTGFKSVKSKDGTVTTTYEKVDESEVKEILKEFDGLIEMIRN